MLDIDDAKTPPPTPARDARMMKTWKGVSGFCSAIPAPRAGRISSSVVMKLALRPPEMATMNAWGMRSVAPARPATAGSVNRSAR